MRDLSTSRDSVILSPQARPAASKPVANGPAWQPRLLPWLLPALLMGLVSAIRLTNPVLSWDEIATVDVATRNTTQIWRLSRTIDASVTPYYLFMHAWMDVFGISEWALRAPSWLAMTVTAGLVAELGRRLYSPATGLLAGMLFALLPSSSRYAQEARVYAIATMLSVIAVLLLYRAIDRPSVGRFTAYGISVALLGAGHLIALTVLGAHLVIIAMCVRRTRDRRPAWVWLAVTATAGLVLSPLALVGVGQLDDQLGWIYGPLTAKDLVTAPGAITGSVGVAWLLIGMATLATWRPSQRVAELIALAVLPVIVVAAGGALGQPIWVPRYLLVATPGLALLAAVGMRQAAVASRPQAPVGVYRRTDAVRIGVVLAAVAGAAVPDQWTLRAVDSRHGANYRQAARIVSRHQHPGDVLLFESRTRHTRPGIYYYLRHESDRPADLLLGQPAAEVGDLRPIEMTDPAARLRGQERVWFFLYGRPADPATSRPDLAPMLTRDFQAARVWRMESSTLVLYKRTHPAS